MQNGAGRLRRFEEQLDHYFDRFEEADEGDDGGEADDEVVDLLASVFDEMDD